MLRGGEERSSRRYWVEKCSTDNCFLKFFIVPGEVRKCLNELVPSAWNEREWHYGERDLDGEVCVDREIELYKLKRNYNELRKRLEGVKIKIDKIAYLTLTDNTNGDWTKLTNIEQVYEPIKGIMNDIEVRDYYNNNNKFDVNKNDLCYKYVRYIYDDGG